VRALKKLSGGRPSKHPLITGLASARQIEFLALAEGLALEGVVR
jgi:hypothetical protein